MSIAVVGAGFAGLAMAIALRKAGRDDFVILERAAELGGTWRDNTYPGVACDVPSHLYGFSGHPNPEWASTFATGPEILGYLRAVAHQEGIGSRLMTRTPMLGANWDRDEELWRIDTGGHPLTASTLILACGRLTEPKIPSIPGLATFPGPIFHSSRWPDGVGLDRLRIAVVGTGASAVQIVPELVRRGSTVTLFQRTPAWIQPRSGGKYSARQRRRLARDPRALATLRQRMLAEGESRHASRSGDVSAAAAAREISLRHLRDQIPDPELRTALTPDYAFGCKRVLLSDDFYPAVGSDAVILEPSALSRVDGSALTSAHGAVHIVDAVVLATGFEAQRQPYAHLVRGEAGTSLAEHWSGGMTSFASTVIETFPNLFVLNGPNASLGHNSAVLMMEEQARYVVSALDYRERSGRSVLRVRAGAEAEYSEEIDRAAAATPWVTGGCTNWYVDQGSGRLTLLWPGTVPEFHDRLAAAAGSEFEPESARVSREPTRGRP